MTSKAKNDDERLLKFACIILDMLLRNNDEVVSKADFKAIIQQHYGIGERISESLVNKVANTPRFAIEGGMMVRS